MARDARHRLTRRITTARVVTRTALLLATLSWLAWLFAPHQVRRLRRRAAAGATRRARYTRGRLQGLRYRMTGGHPDPDVPDEVLADRLRSALGPVEKRLDIPRVLVTVIDRVAHLHGDVASDAEALDVELAALLTPGVVGVESYLRVGMLRDAERPSAGRARPALSEAYKRLMTAADEAGAPAGSAPHVVRAVLGFLADRVPAEEYTQLTAHLPSDVRALCGTPSRRGVRSKAVRTVPQLVASLAPATDPLPPEEARRVVEAVLGTLRELVPEEDDDVAAVLPGELADLWLTSSAPR
jgi:uncharacterized protein (DUF2267 family)